MNQNCFSIYTEILTQLNNPTLQRLNVRMVFFYNSPVATYELLSKTVFYYNHYDKQIIYRHTLSIQFLNKPIYSIEFIQSEETQQEYLIFFF